jgi:MFS transporter, DHA1 family, multidrug resistance protein
MDARGDRRSAARYCPRQSRKSPMSASGTTRSSAEFIALVALTFSLIAMSIDSMLPALADIAADLGARGPNDRQLVLTAFFAGLTLGQLIYGPISDSTGRKPAMYAGIGCFLVGGLICALTHDFTTMVLGRVLQGFGAAGPRIVAMAMVRDLYAGRAMARIMSFVMAVFILVPILAPSIGQLMLLIADWRFIFYGLVVIGAIDFLWLWTRQPETLLPKDRVPLSIGHIMRSAREAVTNRVTLGYTLATGCVFGSFISYLGTSQQIFQEQYGTGKLFALYFGLLAAGIGLASIVNAKLVMRYGMRNLSKWALRSACILSLAFLLVAWLLGGHPPLWAFVAFMMMLFFFNGLLFGNYNALAMEPMGHIAGVAAAVIGSLSSLVAVGSGTPIGQLYDGTVIPLVAGFAVMETLALFVTEWAERGRAARIITPS